MDEIIHPARGGSSQTNMTHTYSKENGKNQQTKTQRFRTRQIDTGNKIKGMEGVKKRKENSYGLSSLACDPSIAMEKKSYLKGR